MKFAAYSNSAPLDNGAVLIPLPSLTPAGVIDILVVAFLIYQALMIVRGTRAGQVANTASVGERPTPCGPRS